MSSPFLTVGIISISFIALFFVLMSVRLIFLKNGQFKGTCASQNPFLKKEGGSCGYCGRNLDEGENCVKNDSLGAVERVLQK